MARCFLRSCANRTAAHSTAGHCTCMSRARSIEHDAGLGGDQRYGYAGRRTEEYQGSFAHHPRTFWPSFCGPPWAWVDGYPVLTELHVEYGLACTASFGNGRLSSAAITAAGSPVTTNCPKSPNRISPLARIKS
jgi:hypothetical protein